MNNTNITETKDQDSTAYPWTAVMVAFCFVSVIAFVEHLTVVFIACLNKTLRQKPFVMSILLLSGSDMFLCVAIFLLSLIHLVSLRQRWICGLAFFLIQLGYVTSLVQTLIICVERYLRTRSIPMMGKFSVRHRLVLTTICIGLCCPILGIPYLFTVQESDIASCGLVMLFRENFGFALFPVKSILFLLWLCTIIVYVITARNFRNNIRKTNRLREMQSVRNKTFAGATEAITPTKDYVIKPRSVTVITGIVETSNVQSKFRDTVPAKLENIAGKSDSLPHYVPSCSLQKGKQPKKSNSNTSHTEILVKTEREEDNDQEEGVAEMDQSHRLCVGETGSWGTSTTSPYSSCPPTTLNVHSTAKTAPQTQVAKAFRIVSTVFIVFLITMSSHTLIGLVSIFYHVPPSIQLAGAIPAAASILTNPFMFAFLLQDFRNILRCQ